MAKDEIKKLLDQINNVLESPEHKRRESLWKEEAVYSRDKFRRISKPQSEIGGQVPVVADPGPTMYAKIFGFNMREYYTKPEVYLENYLKCMLSLYQMGDDTTFSRTIPFWLGTSFDASLFGLDTIYNEEDDPWPGRKLPLENKDALDNMELPNFEKSGLSPLAIRFYTELTDLVRDSGFNIAPPEIIRAPFALAFHIRGFTNLAFDCMEDPEYVHKLVRFLTDARREWYKQREKVLGVPTVKGQLFNDEVDCNVIGPNIYKEYAFPYELELSEFYGGINYWHSCGNITKMLEYIRQIPNLEMINISSWTNYEAAASMCPDIALEICLKPTTDVYHARKEHIVKVVNRVQDICARHNVKSYQIRAGSLQGYGETIEGDFAKIARWIKVVKETVNKN
ncbi:MAG: uroporphyrinogen decarboxylase family protein [Bacillota bacterium]|nr:uroporphyrinogen decarboxylase family protein [Bacillota bacterium]